MFRKWLGISLLVIGAFASGCPMSEPALNGKDNRLIGTWVGEACTVVNGGYCVEEVTVTITNSTLTLDGPDEAAYQGEYYCSTSTTPMKIDWYSPVGLNRGLYTFGQDPTTLIWGWNRADTGTRPSSINSAESAFVGEVVLKKKSEDGPLAGTF